MNDIIFTYHQETALAAGQSGFISESGAYIFNITEAKYMNSPSGAKSIEFSVETDDGRKANYLNLYYEKKDGTANAYGVNLIQQHGAQTPPFRAGKSGYQGMNA